MRKASSELKRILSGVQPTHLEFVSKIDAFYANKIGIEACKASSAEPGELERVDMMVLGIVHESTGEYNLKHYQRGMDGTSPIRSAKDLYKVAKRVLSEFKQMLNDVAAEAGEGVVAVVGPLKEQTRAEKKAKDDYSDRPCAGDGPAIGWVFDIVRGKFLCIAGASLEKVVRLLEKDPRIKCTLKFKNRFKNPTANGYGDYLLQVVFQTGTFVHVCEIQVHLRAVSEYADSHGSHESYEYFRVFFAGSMNTVEARLAEMQLIVGDQYVPAAKGTSGAIVLEQLVLDVVESRDFERLDNMVQFCSAYLSLDDLALYIEKTNLTVTIEAKGKDHIDVGQKHRKIGVLLQSSHKYDEAMPFFEKALAIFKNPSCTDGTAVAYDDIIDKMLGLVYDNIATVSSDQGKLGAAKRLHEKSLGHYEAFIEKHADESNGGYADEDDLANCGTAYSNVGLAVSELYHAEGGKVDMLDYAIECHQNALGTYAVAYDGDETEPDIAMVHQRLGRVLRELEGQDRHAEAMESFQKALAIYVEIYGEISAEVGGAHNEIAGLLCDMDKHDEAMATYETALAIMMDVFGEDSDGVAMVYKNMGISEGHREDYPQALALLTKAASIYANIYGDTHPETLGILEQVEAAQNLMEDESEPTCTVDDIGAIKKKKYKESKTLIGKLVISDKVTKIGKDAFSECKKLTSVVIGPSVTTIEESAFSGCKNLTSIVIGSSVKKIGEGAFEYCKNLTSVVFGPSVETIDKSAFGHCKNLPYIDFKNLTPDALDFRSSIKTIEFAAFLGCEALSGTLFIPDSVKKIGNWAFSETGYTDVSMPKIRKCKLIGNPFLGIGGHSNWCIQRDFKMGDERE